MLQEGVVGGEQKADVRRLHGPSMLTGVRLFAWFRRSGLPLLSAIALLVLIGAWNSFSPTGPATPLHYGPNHNFAVDGTYLPGELGFNLADLNTVDQLDSLPHGVKGLVWVGQCDGVTPGFLQKVQPFVGHAKLFGFYLMDNPDPVSRLTRSGQVPACTSEHLRAESDWIHAHLRDARTFMILMNLGSAERPQFSAEYSPDIIHLDLYGIDPYPCRTELDGCAYDMIDRYIRKAEAAGIPRNQMVPVYQAFGGGDYRDDAGGIYTLPTAAEEQQILARWGEQLPRPVFDYAYSWGSQRRDSALEGAMGLHSTFSEHNSIGVDSKR